MQGCLFLFLSVWILTWPWTYPLLIVYAILRRMRMGSAYWLNDNLGSIWANAVVFVFATTLVLLGFLVLAMGIVNVVTPYGDQGPVAGVLEFIFGSFLFLGFGIPYFKTWILGRD